MKKRLLSILAVCAAAIQLNAQSPVPASWNCEGSLPTGFTTNQTPGDQFYVSATCNNQPGINPSSFKLNATGRFLQVFFATEPGKVAYEIGGQTGGSAQWDGTFEVQESENGSTWSTLKTYSGLAAIPNQNAGTSCLADTVTPSNSNIRYIRFFYTTKLSGSNIKLDNISVGVPAFTVQKAKISQAGTEIFDDGVSNAFGGPVSSPTAVSFLLENIAVSGTLTIDSIRVSGPFRTEYVVNTPASGTNVNPGGSVNINMAFTPTASGTRTAFLNVYTNDPSNPNYTFELYGVGGTLATEPANSANSISVSDVKTFRHLLKVKTTGSAVETYGGFLVVRSVGAPLTGAPVDGTPYFRGMGLGNGKVIFAGKPTAGDSIMLMPTNVLAGTTYHFTVFPYNGTGTFTNYRTAAPLTGQATTPSTMVNPNEYSAIDVNASTFVTDLQALVNPHTPIFYSNYIQTMIQSFMVRDTFVVVGPNTFTSTITCAYSNQPVVFSTFAFGATGTSREHTFPHSWMPTFPADSPEKPEYNDQHHLFPTIQVGVNDLRCNYPFGEVVTPIQTTGEGTLGIDAAGNRVYEPSDAHKGRAARALMYIAATYNGVSGNQWNFNAPIGENCNGVGINYAQDMQTILNWHFQYPPTSFDIARNDYLDSLQGNRNPFVDHPEYACYIDFRTMTYIANPNVPCTTLVGLEPVENVHFTVFPNPSQGQFNVNIFSENAEMADVRVLDLTGKLVYNGAHALTNGNTTIAMDLNLSSGVYLLQVRNSKATRTQKLVIR